MSELETRIERENAELRVAQAAAEDAWMAYDKLKSEHDGLIVPLRHSWCLLHADAVNRGLRMTVLMDMLREETRVAEKKEYIGGLAGD